MYVSVVIPTLNEQRYLPGTLRRLRACAPDEIIVVDGGSSDRTRTLARDADRLVVTQPGRGRQQNAGAQAARGDVIWFLHADCRPLPACQWADGRVSEWQGACPRAPLTRSGAPSPVAAIRQALRDPGCVAGSFRQQIGARGVCYRTLEWTNALRARFLKLPFGDQGIFVRRDAFFAAGGFPETPMMEDLLLMRRLRRLGRIALLDARLFVSGRRWRRAGLLGQTARNWTLIALERAGFGPERLARFYPDVR